MIIISKHRDYYDYVGQQYGGGDPNVVYDRRKKPGKRSPDVKYGGKVYSKGEELGYFEIEFSPMHRLHQVYHDSFHLRNFESINVRNISVVGNLYAIISGKLKDGSVSCEDRVLSDKHPLWNSLTPEIRGKLSPIKSNMLFELHRKLRMPVFEFADYAFDVKSKHLAIRTVVPILGDLGFAQVIKPEKLWQDIAYFCGNSINRNPDEMPVSKMTDTEKLLAAGFDKKVSFRKRK